MPARILALVAVVCLTGCIATPRIEFAETLHFDYVQQDVSPMSYNDLLCCYDCHA